jgi:hypothetical protein
LNRIKSRPHLAHHYANVITVDSYQGEENGIITLSLVRNNERGDIRFLEVDNRVNKIIDNTNSGVLLLMLWQCRVLYLLSDLVDQETVEWEDNVALRDLENFAIPGECSTREKGNQDMISAFAPPYAVLREPLAEAAYKHAMGLA